MRGKALCTVSCLAVVLILASLGQATTITFDDSPGNNQDVPTNHGSNIAAEAVGFVTTDGTGATPDIVLTWAAYGDAYNDAGEYNFDGKDGVYGPDIWEYNAHSNMAAIGFSVPVAQMDCSSGGPTSAGGIPDELTVTFETQSNNVAVKINSLDIGTAIAYGTSGGPPIQWGINITRVSDNMQVYSTLTHAMTGVQGVDYVETVNLDFTGDLGEDYVLTFVRPTGYEEHATCLDNLSFSQVPEPSTLVLLVLAGLTLVGMRRRSQ